ncbi:MAG TPA: RNA polymerase subunit sigma-24 [Verrucomicrobiales bacterium]|nr:RNA polymerase subunit sigma-24 [Verrucomicrobiales bacterium]
MEFDLADCLARVRRNDEAAARDLVEELHPLVIKIVRGHLPRRLDEEDVTQEIFMKLFAKLDQYHGNVPIGHWVSRVALNHCYNLLRAQRSRPEWRMADLPEEHAAVVEAQATDPDRDPHPAEALGARELVARLMDLLRPRERMLIQLLDIEERSIEEVRKLTGWSAVLVRVGVHRARKKLNSLYRKLKSEGKL